MTQKLTIVAYGFLGFVLAFSCYTLYQDHLYVRALVHLVNSQPSAK